VEALFERIDVLGISSVEITPTPEADACGWADAFGEPVALSGKSVRLVGARGLEPAVPTPEIIVSGWVSWALTSVA
jgi:hypothetical protein